MTTMTKAGMVIPTRKPAGRRSLPRSTTLAALPTMSLLALGLLPRLLGLLITLLLPQLLPQLLLLLLVPQEKLLNSVS